jgi:hypothetical protein
MIDTKNLIGDFTPDELAGYWQNRYQLVITSISFMLPDQIL